MPEYRSHIVDALVADLEPVRPFRLRRTLAALLLLETAVLVVAVLVSGVRADLAARLVDPRSLVLMAVLTTAAAGSAWAALRLSVPGRDLSRIALTALVALPVLAAVVTATLLPWGGEWTGFGPVLQTCWRCIARTAATAALPWAVVVLLVSRLAPLRPLRIALFAGVSAFALGALATEFHCAAQDAYHLAVGHYAPVSLLAAATAWIVARSLGSRLSASRGSADGHRD
jgi:hypothetical protein